MVRALRHEAWAPAPDAAPAAVAPDFRGDGPARQLQQELERAIAGVAAEPRWSRQRSAVFILATNAALWLALIATFRAL